MEDLVLDDLMVTWTDLMREYAAIYECYIEAQDRLIVDDLFGDEFESPEEYEDVLFEYNMFEESLSYTIEDLEHLEAVIVIYGGVVPTLDDVEDEVVCKHCQCHCS